MKRSDTESMQMWRNAVPISLARFKYVPSDLVCRYKELDQITFMSEYNSTLSETEVSNGEVFAVLKRTMDKISPISSEKWDILRQIDRIFFDQIISKKLRTFAFVAPRHFSDDPVELEPDHWSAHPTWESGELKANGLHFIEVRVLLAQQSRENISTPVKPKHGRPSFDIEIHAAFRALKEQGKLIERPLSANFTAMREWIRFHHPASKAAQAAISNDVIRKSLKRMNSA